MPRLLLIALLAAAPCLARAAPARLAEPEVRAFLDRQSRAWNAGDLAAYFALFTADARFTDQARARDGRVVPYGTSTLPQAQAQARRFFAASKVRETTTVRRVAIAPDGRSAQVASDEVTLVTGGARPRHECAERVQTLIATPAGLRSRGQTDTLVRCR